MGSSIHDGARVPFFFFCPREENPLILDLGECGGKDMFLESPTH